MMTRFGSLVERVDHRRAGIDLPLMSVSQTRGVIRRSELTDRPQRAESLDTYKICRKNDIVFNKMSIRSGAMGVAPEDGLVTYHYEVMRPRPETSPQYVAYLMKSAWFTEELIKRERGIGAGDQANVRTTEVPFSVLKYIDCYFPPLDEQRAIADYLDRETAWIDMLIGEQQRLIEMLRERRGAVADQLLNPPSHMQPLKRIVADVTVGIVVNPTAWYADEGVPALRGLNIRPELVIADDLVYLTEEGDESHAKSRLRAGDVVMVRTGQAGTAAVIPHGLDGANAIDLLIVRPGPNVDSNFLAAYCNAPSTREKVTHGSVGAIQGHFNVSALRELEFPYIDIAEQRDRARKWSVEAGRIDNLIAETETFMELARERRSALITAAVTGQIDVRGAA